MVHLETQVERITTPESIWDFVNFLSSKNGGIFSRRNYSLFRDFGKEYGYPLFGLEFRQSNSKRFDFSKSDCSTSTIGDFLGEVGYFDCSKWIVAERKIVQVDRPFKGHIYSHINSMGMHKKGLLDLSIVSMYVDSIASQDLCSAIRGLSEEFPIIFDNMKNIDELEYCACLYNRSVKRLSDKNKEFYKELLSPKLFPETEVGQPLALDVEATHEEPLNFGMGMEGGKPNPEALEQ